MKKIFFLLFLILFFSISLTGKKENYQNKKARVEESKGKIPYYFSPTELTNGFKNPAVKQEVIVLKFFSGTEKTAEKVVPKNKIPP